MPSNPGPALAARSPSKPAPAVVDAASKYNYNNLPSFGTRRVRPYGIKTRSHPRVASGNLLASPQRNNERKSLPFVPKERLLPDTLLEEAALRHAEKHSGRNFASGSSAASSHTSKRTLFAKRINGAFRTFSTSFEASEAELRRKLAGNNTSAADDTANPEPDLMQLLTLLLSALLALAHKGYSWTVYILTLISTRLVRLVDRIPSAPEADTTPTNIESLAFQSTPVGSQRITIEQVDSPIVSRANRASRLADIIREPQKETAEDASVRQYGTFFFDSERKQSGLNLEAMFLKKNFEASKAAERSRSTSVISESPNEYQDHNTRVVGRAAEVMGEVSRLFSMKGSSSDRRLRSPPLMRSTKMFKDMEWYRDDNEDYLHNLESTKLFNAYQKIMEERLKLHQLERLTKMKEAAKVRPLGAEQQLLVDQWWRSSNLKAEINSQFGISMTVRDLATLGDRKWLNDNIIDYYMNLIIERAKEDGSLPSVHAFSTYFYTSLSKRGYDGVRRWAKRAKVDVTKTDLIFVPINVHSSHWVLGVVDTRNKSFQYYDSLFGTGSDVLADLQDYMVQETKRLYGDSLNGIDYSKWDFNPDAKCPVQKNGFDCGVFVCTAADYLARETPLLYSQADMPNLRRRMAYEICQGRMVH